MALYRVEHTQNYTVMCNHHLRDKRLSLKAKGLLSQMLSLPEDWNYTLSGLARINAEGKDAIRSALVELEEAGYVTRSRARDRQGHLLGNEYVIREVPSFCAQPALEKPAAESPAQEKPAQLKKEKDKIPDSPSKDSIPSPSSPSRPAAGPRNRREWKGTDCVSEAAGPRNRRERKRRDCVSERELNGYRDLIRENVGYDSFVAEHPYDAGRLDELVELMVEAVCSKADTLRVAGNELPQAVVKSRLLKMDGSHIRFVFECLQENTTRIRNIKRYLLTVLFNAPATIDSHYAAQVNHDLYGGDG